MSSSSTVFWVRSLETHHTDYLPWRPSHLYESEDVTFVKSYPVWGASH